MIDNILAGIGMIVLVVVFVGCLWPEDEPVV